MMGKQPPEKGGCFAYMTGSPYFASTALMCSKFSADGGHMGDRSSPARQPKRLRAVFTGMGFTSQNMASQKS